ncbi:hypothetical protein JW796_00610 [Candidatus Dojkabacteria bacterium]|nr:hypothetical protein [Candidatus Dojkabacteria bacterium]
MDIVFFDEKIVRIFGRAMGFEGLQLEAFVADYNLNLVKLFIHSALEHIGTDADPKDMNELQRIADDIAEERSEDLTELGEFLGKKMLEYPEAGKKVDHEISVFNEGILADFIAHAPEKSIKELLIYIAETRKKNQKVAEMIEKMKAEAKRGGQENAQEKTK